MLKVYKVHGVSSRKTTQGCVFSGILLRIPTAPRTVRSIAKWSGTNKENVWSCASDFTLYFDKRMEWLKCARCI